MDAVNALALLADLLARLVADGDITEKQAADIIAYWRDRPAAELAALLPLPLAEGVGARRASSDDDQLVFFLIAVAGVGPNARAAQRRAGADRVQDAHAALSESLANELTAGRLPVARWQAAQRALNAHTLSVMAATGSPRMTADLQQRIAATEQEQAAYLQRFADQLAARKLAEALPEDDDQREGLLRALVAMGAAYIARRAASYSGAARGVFFRALESGDVGPMGGGRSGWVIAYRVNHDESLCSACLDAEGYYLPGDGPMPGEVCLGGGQCRCWREDVYDPVLWAQLAGVGVTV